MTEQSFALPEMVTIGGFRLPKYGSLKQKEDQWFDERDEFVMRGMIEVLQISQEISTEHSIAPNLAYSLVSSYGSLEGSELLVPYANRLAPLMDLLGHQKRTSSEAVTMLLQSRLDSYWLKSSAANFQSAFGLDIGDAEKWQPEFTLDLPKAVIGAVWDFIMGERRQWKPVAEINENLGEGSASTENGSPKTDEGTGETVTGQSKSAPSTTDDSTQKTSLNVPSTFSSSRLKG